MHMHTKCINVYVHAHHHVLILIILISAFMYIDSNVCVKKSKCLWWQYTYSTYQDGRHTKLNHCYCHQPNATHHVVLKWLQQLLQKSLVREERTLVQLFLSQVKVVMHGLHEGTEKVHTRETDTVIITLDGAHNLLANNLTKAASVCDRQ